MAAHVGMDLRILIPPFPGSNPGSPATVFRPAHPPATDKCLHALSFPFELKTLVSRHQPSHVGLRSPPKPDAEFTREGHE